jgi:hypothetical protein
MIKSNFFQKISIKFLLVFLLLISLSLTLVFAFNTSSNNISINILKTQYTVDESVIISVAGAPILDTSIYLDIYLLEDPSYSFRYLGIINEDIIFIPQIKGTYVLKLYSIKEGQPLLLSQNQFIVEDFVEKIADDKLVSESELSTISEVISNDVDSNGEEVNNVIRNGINKKLNNSSNFSNCSLVKRNKFSGETTDFEKYANNISLLKKLSNVTIDHPGVGRIKWHDSINVLDADIDANIQIAPGLIVVNSEILDTSFNSSATLTMYDISYASPIILKNDQLCSNCNILSYVDGVLEFDVTSFSNYTVVENTSLIIWDNNDLDEEFYNGNLTKYVDQNIFFYANYSNYSDNNSIIDADCSIIFSDNASQSFNMVYDTISDLYFYNRTFSINDTYQYNITCNKTGFYILNLTDDVIIDLAGDLVLYSEEITFSQKYPVENESIQIFVTIYSLTDYNYSDVLVRFYDGNPLVDGLFIGDTYINITGLSNVTNNITWLSKVGLHNIYIQIDPLFSINDLNRSNNVAYNNTFTSLWQIYHGQITSSTTNLGSNNATFLNWSLSTSSSVNIYVTSAGSNINWMSLEAITRNNTGGQDVDSLNDFEDIDLSLSIENFSDSINSTYSIGGYPISISNYSIYHVLVRDVPETMSTNNTNFYTGILWDTSDAILPYYSYDSVPSFRSDLLFVTKVNYNQQGAYGIYDYEIKVPAFLREYKGDEGVVQFYYEIQ